MDADPSDVLDGTCEAILDCLYLNDVSPVKKKVKIDSESADREC
jgi:hypothetical protein